MMGLKAERSPLEVFADILSIITILTCFILKIPQIVNVIKVQNSQAISILGLLMELSSYTVMCLYNYRNNHAILSYMEYPIILIQEIILIYFVLYYKSLINTHSLFQASIYFAVTGGFYTGIFSKDILTFLVPLCTPVGASSKLVQIVEIIKTKDSESISLLTWFISAFTNLTRIFTVYMDSADLSLLLNFSVSTILSTSVLLVAYIYKKHRKDD